MPTQPNFANSVARHLPYLKRIARRLTQYGSLTEDLVQQTRLKALVHADQFRCESSLKTWLTSMARNATRFTAVKSECGVSHLSRNV